MGFCSNRSFVLTICILQLIFVFWRQIFDFLGYMWGPIFINFFQIIFVIFGFFGACQYRAKYTISYTVWTIFWCAWNVFIFCFYLNVGGLNRESDILGLGTGAVSWWESNGPGCKASFLGNLTSLEEYPWKPPRPDIVTGCLVEYQHLEAIQAALHAVLAILGICGGFSLSRSLLEDDDESPVSKSKKPNGPPPLYSIEYTPRHNNEDTDDYSSHEVLEDGDNRLPSSRPMTPRRVKRRSINSRGSSGGGTLLNPPPPPHYNNIPPPQRRSTRSSTRSSGRHRHKTAHQNPVTRIIDHQQQKAAAASSHSVDQLGNRGSLYGGHCNPLYQQSSTHSLDQECERPPSARSTYSNYHGSRAFSYVGGIATPQVPPPHPNRHSSAFLSGGPPAYNLHSNVDSETVI
ncbi:sodium/potassium-transporting ATPase subunit beta-1-interacting protein isoform X2 [Nilaparvata lugens]|uniref:sodium/potassium-transporting ATPase subunit beta-1-interacting protein isoform X2 n=1 Tax=Nilaparvata lugens TaxID=108931 RepID=UPI000B996096|nr:sodium/potassium-transporting ATPase subunit beta-1-interacting protein isoform X2 [Nilaparvata lugens]